MIHTMVRRIIPKFTARVKIREKRATSEKLMLCMSDQNI